MNNDQPAATLSYAEPPGAVEVDHDGPQARVRFALPQEWFTLPELRAFAAFLAAVADDNEPSPELDALARVLETPMLIAQSPRALARYLLQSGYRLEHTPAKAS